MPLGSSIIRAQGNRDHQPGTLSIAYSRCRGGGRDCLKAQPRRELIAFQATLFPVLLDWRFSSFTFSPFLSPNSQHSGLCNGQLSLQWPGQLSYLSNGQHGAPNAANIKWQLTTASKHKIQLKEVFHGMIQKRQCADHLFLSNQHTHYLQARKGVYFSTYKYESPLENKVLPQIGRMVVPARGTNESTQKYLNFGSYFIFAPSSRQPQEHVLPLHTAAAHPCQPERHQF